MDLIKKAWLGSENKLENRGRWLGFEWVIEHGHIHSQKAFMP
jgi:hypothetical protein